MLKDIRAGLASTAGVYDEDGFSKAVEVLDRIEREGLETVRLSFADQHGLLRGKTLVPEAVPSAFASGLNMTSTLLLKDTSHRTVFPVWGEGPGLGQGRLDGAGDVLIFPDPASFRVLPWSPRSGWMLCDIRYADGSEMPFCTRSMLGRAVAALEGDGMALIVGPEIEFHIHQVTNPRLNHADAGMPGTPPDTELLSHGYQYLTEARYDVLEPVLDAIRRAAVALELPIRTLEVEFGPSQVEVTLAPTDPVLQADQMTLFRHAAREVCRRMGLHATFMARPHLPSVVPSGLHIHQSLTEITTGKNAFASPDGAPTAAVSGWVAGLLEHAAASCLMAVPTVNGYKRFQPNMLAPDRIQWSRDNKGAMIRALLRPGDPASRIENRIADPAANPYLLLTSQIYAGRDGLVRSLRAPPPENRPYCSDAPRLPVDLGTAIAEFRQAALWQQELGEEAVRWLATIKSTEWQRFLCTVTDWEHREYYGLV